MRLTFLIFLLLFKATLSWAQTDISKPTMGQVLSPEVLPPGTIKVVAVPLNLTWEDATCQQELQKIAVSIERVITTGSGLINPVSQGDTLNMRILKGMDFPEESLAGNDTLLLKEQLCAFGKTYFTLIRKE